MAVDEHSLERGKNRAKQQSPARRVFLDGLRCLRLRCRYLRMSAYQNQMQSVRDMAEVVAVQFAKILAVARVKRIYGIVADSLMDSLTRSGARARLSGCMWRRLQLFPIPPAITIEMAKGFTLYMVKAVFNGRADDLVDLAESNLWA
jgi:hypothetical protein